MPPKRESSTTLRLSEEEKEMIRRVSYELGECESDVIRACIAIGLPVLQKCALLRRVRLEDAVAVGEFMSLTDSDSDYTAKSLHKNCCLYL